MSDGHKAYSRLKVKDGCYIIEDKEQCAFIQVRENGHLKMIRI